jgi:hypothetical protein
MHWMAAEKCGDLAEKERLRVELNKIGPIVHG